MPFETFHLSTDADKEQQAQIDRDNAAMKAEVDRQKGRYGGPAPVAGWSIRIRPDGSTVWMKPDPASPTNKVLIYDPNSGQKQLPQPGDGVFLGGKDGELMDQLRTKYSHDNAGGFPLGGKGWDQYPGLRHPNFANFGQLNAIDQMMSKYRNYNRPSQQQTDFYRQANNTADLYRDIEKNYALVNGKAGLNKFMQWGQQFKTETDIANFGNWLLTGGPMGGRFAGGADPERDAYLKIIRDVVQLQRAGVDITKLGPQAGVSSQIVDAINNGVQSIPWVKALGLGAPIESATEIAKKVLSGQLDPDSLKAQVPYLKLVTDQAIHDGVYNGVHNGQIYWDDNTLRYANKAAKDLNDNHLNPGDPISDAPVLKEPGEPEPNATPNATPTPSGTPKVKPTPGKTPTPPPKPSPLPGDTSSRTDPDKGGDGKGKVQSPSPDTTTTGTPLAEAMARGEITASEAALADTSAPKLSPEQENSISKSVARGDMTAKEGNAMRARLLKEQADAAAAAAQKKKDDEEKPDETDQKNAAQQGDPFSRTITELAAGLKPAPIGPVSTTGEPSESGYEFGGRKIPQAPAYTGPPIIANKSSATAAANTPPPEPPQPTSTAEEFHNPVPAYNIPPSYGGPVQPADWLNAPNQGARTPEEQKALEEARKPSEGLTPDQQKALEERVRKFGSPGQTSAEPVASDVAVGAPLGAGDAPGVNRLHHQEHVDALEPGTPFYWRDHANAYVRV